VTSIKGMPEFLEPFRNRNDIVLVKLGNGAIEEIDVHEEAWSVELGARSQKGDYERAGSQKDQTTAEGIKDYDRRSFSSAFPIPR
jgi:hypothetical protein